jgi:hypothetical protein
VSSSADERRGGRVTVKRVTTAFDRREGRNGGGVSGLARGQVEEEGCHQQWRGSGRRGRAGDGMPR